jgi:pimeloyl-ACP methyl ester carboxylesterase
MYSFYIEAKRYREARQTIEEAIQRFPTELANRVGLIAQTQQLLSNQQFEEINIRREAGQTQLAYRMLSAFPKELIESQIRIKNELDQLGRNLELLAQIAGSLRERVDRLTPEDRAIAAPLIDELLEEMTIDSAIRLDDYVRLGAGDSMANENMVALAVGGWILGPGAGIQNFAIAKSLIRVRQLTREYLVEQSPEARLAILAQLKSEDGAQPELLAKLLTMLKPPLDLPEHNAQDPVGYYRQTVRLNSGDEVQYTIQLPPEYDPNRKYPCIVALPGSVAEHQLNISIDYWCGSVVPLEGWEGRFGQATRYGYIVISPNWLAGRIGGYQYTEGEKARILACYRDALRRASIDADRAFISGHFEGATAAWDIAQSHPDLWAGAVLISPTADKYIPLYHSNVQAPRDAPNDVPLATYIVYGEMDGVRMNSPGIGITADRYLKNLQYDSIVVEHIGQGRGLFSSELPRIMQWMQLSSRRRQRAPRVLDFVTMRPGDRFFYWLEVDQVSPEVVSNSLELQPRRDAARRGKFEANLLDSAINGVRVSKVPSADRGAWVWLSPEMVDFGRDITLIFRGKTTKYNLTPDISVMLEDVRQRGDRSHFFWQKVALGASA